MQISGALFAVAFAFAAAGCAAQADDGSGAPREWEPQADPAAKPGDTSEMNPDGTPSTTTPAGTPVACVAKTCKELGKSSGTTDDGCGKTIDCSTAATCTDAKEANNTKDAAADLGAMTDNPMSTRVVADLTLADGDEDWFKFKVTDGGFGGNPRIDVSVSSGTAEVSVFYVCDSQPDYSTCTNATDTADTTVGKGCRAKGSVSLSTECSGLSETGTAYVRVRKSAADSQCTMYALSVKVD